MGFQMSKNFNATAEAASNAALVEKADNIASAIAESSKKPKDETSFQSRVARLSICEDDKSREMILKSMLRRESSDILIDDDRSSNSSSIQHQQQKAGSKRRRRRSSGIAGPSFVKNADGVQSASPVIVTKKKKKASQPATLTVSQKALQKRISMKDLRDLVLYIFQDTNNSPSWIQIENRVAINKMIVLFVPGLLPEDFEDNKKHTGGDRATNARATSLISLQDTELLDVVQRVPVSAPGSKSTLYSAYNSFVNVGLSKKEKEEKRQELSKKSITLNDLVMKSDQLLENEYPLHEDTVGLSSEDTENLLAKHLEQGSIWKSTRPFEHDGSHTFAMDCEMCMADSGLVLTRVSLVDFECNLIYDRLVKPDVPIVDYLTKYSGITEEKLRDVTTTLHDVQSDILKLVSSDDILIGHSLQSDLNVLKIRHPRIIDTAMIYEHKAGPPFRPALKYLAFEYLSQEIQNSEGLGHDSFEDARACMELTKLKIVNGLAFGIGMNTENLFQRLARNGIKSMCLNDYAPRQNELISNTKTLEFNKRCQCDDEIFDNIDKHIDDFNLFVGRLRDLEYARDFAVPPQNVEKKDVLTARNNFVSKFQVLYQKCPPSTVFLVCSGTGDTRDWSKIMAELNMKNKDERFEEKKKREVEIQAAVSKARDAIALIMGKKVEMPKPSI
ncbi:LANO_0C09010g1_1 [Lachancea nothofagi CBS 11611]|uniref:LANO_0C09010g1_1 n=1 Tax=Lachancea nothofagi CBS 11611 TaxID=1266666 RepID=A0A1G4JA95_9SACH|nr:LANO_0C09010g1_1 [Lachancea nothofagi CBS 11611]